MPFLKLGDDLGGDLVIEADPFGLGVCGATLGLGAAAGGMSHVLSSCLPKNMSLPEKRGWAARCDWKGPPRRTQAPKGVT